MRTTSSQWLLGMAERFQWMGLPVLELFQQANISLQSLANPSVRVPQDNVSALWKAAEMASGSESIGLLVGQQQSVAASPMAVVGILQCSSAVAGINLILRYQKMIGETSNIQMTQKLLDDDGRYEVSLDFLFYDDQQPLSPHTRDVAMASTVRVARLIEGESWTPKIVQLRRRVNSPDAHRDFYGCEVLFERESDRIVFEAEQGNPTSSLSLGSQQTHLPEQENSPKALSEMIAMVLPEQLRCGEFMRADIARLFNISERTLQRRLAAEELRYTDVLDQVRKEQSSSLLRNTDFSQTEVAFICGFSDLSAFHHAFQRWHQMSPGQYREHQGLLTDPKQLPASPEADRFVRSRQ